MYKQCKVLKEPAKSNAVNVIPKKTGKNNLSFFDNRKEALIQKQIQSLANNSQQVLQLKAIQKVVTKSGSDNGVIQRVNTIVDNPKDPQNTVKPGTGEGLLKDSSGVISEWVHFGALRNDCGTSMQAWIMPADDDWGSVPKSGSWPDWWAAEGPINPNYWVRGHLLNHNLGGPGEKRNLTPITKTCNSMHHNLVEKTVKAAFANGLMLIYTVTAIYDGTGPTNLKKDNTDPALSALPKITTGFNCEFSFYNKDDGTVLRTLKEFIENKR